MTGRVIRIDVVARCPVSHCSVLMIDTEERATKRMTEHIMRKHKCWLRNRDRPAAPPQDHIILENGHPARQYHKDGYDSTENCAAYALRVLLGWQLESVTEFMYSVSDMKRTRRAKDPSISSSRFLEVLPDLGFRVERFAEYLTGVGQIGICEEFRREPWGNPPVPTFAAVSRKRNLNKALCLGYGHAWAVINGAVIDDRNITRRRVRAVGYLE